MSTRRFFARPSLVLLVAPAGSRPLPSVVILAAGMPLDTMYSPSPCWRGGQTALVGLSVPMESGGQWRSPFPMSTLAILAIASSMDFAAFGFQHVLVEVEQRFGLDGDGHLDRFRCASAGLRALLAFAASDGLAAVAAAGCSRQQARPFSARNLVFVQCLGFERNRRNHRALARRRIGKVGGDTGKCRVHSEGGTGGENFGQHGNFHCVLPDWMVNFVRGNLAALSFCLPAAA